MENNITQIVKQYPNDMELGGKIREMANNKFIYESPDGGKTITKRPLGSNVEDRITIRKPKYSKQAYDIVANHNKQDILDALQILNNK